MGLRIITPPTKTPIEMFATSDATEEKSGSDLGLEAIKNHLRHAIDVEEEDSLILAYVDAAWEYCQQYTWRTFLETTYQLSLPHWFAQDDTCGLSQRRIVLPKPPVIHGSSIVVAYTDSEGESQTMAATEYVVDWTADLVTVRPAVNACWPELDDREDAVKITYTAGYGDEPDDMPRLLLHAVKLLVGMYFETREPEQHRSTTVDSLLAMLCVRDDRLACVI